MQFGRLKHFLWLHTPHKPSPLRRRQTVGIALAPPSLNLSTDDTGFQPLSSPFPVSGKVSKYGTKNKI